MSAPDKPQENPENQPDEPSSTASGKDLKKDKSSDKTADQQDAKTDVADESDRDDTGGGALVPAGIDAQQDADTKAEDEKAEDDVASTTSDDQSRGEDTIVVDASDTAVPIEPAVDNGVPPGIAPVVPSQPKVIERETIERKGGFVPMVLGGIVAAGLGFIASPVMQDYFAPPPNPFEAEARASLQGQADSIGALEARISDVSGAVDAIDLGALETGLSTQIDALGQQLNGLSEQISAFDTRITALEKAPMIEAVSPETVAAYQRELDALSASVEQQRAEIESMAADAVAAQQDASRQALQAQARAALARLTAQLQNGDPFAEQVTTLEQTGFDVANPLADVAADGVPTLAALAADFPDLAREALAAARGSDDSADGLGSFLQRQLGARSITPRDGDDPDAVLSRAEAALTAGDLSMTLNELATLPEPAQAVLADWVARAQIRLAALGAAESLAIELNQE